MLALLVICFVLAVNCIEKQEDIVVALKHGGRVRGSILTTREGKEFYAYRGIPYAESPEGDLRFKPPIPKKPWTDQILDATEDGPICIQFDPFRMKPTGQEDCLGINVYTTEFVGINKTESDKRAVIFFVHGGSFMTGDGSSKTYWPGMLIDSDIVLVTPNYRLDAFGFLSTGDEAFPGNYGLLDQTLALKWVQENIEMFGGDPDRVTLFGGSAGAASVSHHILSPLSKGLFHRAIAMSGSATCPWAINDDAPDWSKQLAEDFKCPTDNSQEMVNCLRKIPAEDIVKLTPSYARVIVSPIPFRPSVDGYFLPEHPLQLLASPDKINQVPVITGITKEEGAFFMSHILSGHPGKSLTSEEFQMKIVDNLIATYKPVPEVTELLHEAYLSSVDVSNEAHVRTALIDAISEGSFDMCHYESASLMSKAGLETYVYSYEYDGSFRFSQLYGIPKHNWGVSHADDLLMFFPFPGHHAAKKTKELSNKMIKLWKNFAKYGIPTPNNDDDVPHWPPTKDDKLLVYHFNDPITVEPLDFKSDQKYHLWTRDVRKARRQGGGYSSGYWSSERLQKEEL